MILEAKAAESVSIGSEETIEMGIDPSDKAMLMAILSEGLYSDPIGSTVREWTSNALDACREVGVVEPIIVSLKEEKNTWWFSVQDFGIGISEDRMKNVVSKYAASTKRASEDQLGMFGLGLKSGLAYSDSFMLDTVSEGTEYRYIFYKGEYGTKIDLLSKTDTDKRNGTTIKLSVKREDVYLFINAIKQQLRYFEGVYFDVNRISNDFQIIGNEDWKYSTFVTESEMHLCLDNVYYAMDFKKLGISNINLPVAINFSTKDGLRPTPNREQIMFTPQVKEMILAKIKKVANYFVQAYNDKIEDCKDILGLWEWASKPSYVEIEGHTFQVSYISKFSDIDMKIPKVPGVDILPWNNINQEDFLFEYSTISEIMNSGTYRTKNLSWGTILDNIKRGTVIILLEPNQSPTKVQVDYLKSLNIKVLFVRKTVTLKLERKGGGTSYKTLLSLRRKPKTEWRQLISEFKILVKGLTDKMSSLDKYSPTQEWLEERKRNRAIGKRAKVTKVEINPKFVFMNSFSKPSLEKPILIDIAETRKMPAFTIYGSEEDREILGRLRKMKTALPVKDSNKIRVAILCQRDLDKLEKVSIHNWIKLDKFMEGKTAVFSRFCTRYIINKYVSENTWLFENINIVEKFSKSLSEDMHELNSYITGMTFYRFDEKLIHSMLEVCVKHNMWDNSIISNFRRVKNDAKFFNFLKYLSLTSKESKDAPEDLIALCKDILRVRKFRMDWENYSAGEILTGEVEVVEEVIKEEKEEEIDFATV